MRIFLAGATGAVGRRLVPLLIQAGHDVVGLTRTLAKADNLRAMGAEPAVADALDPDAVMKAVSEARPEVLIHQLTAIPDGVDLRHFDRDFALTDRLRTEGTRHLVAAATEAGARRLVAQGFAGWGYAREGGPIKTEADPLDPDPPAVFRRTLDALRELEAAVLGARDLAGIVLRYGWFYGPGTSIGEGGSVVEAVRRRRMPIVGKGSGVWSFVHIDDVAAATVAAVERGAPGVYNVAADDPAPVAEWLPALAEAVGARPPRRVPVWLARLLVGAAGVALMTENRGISSAKAKLELGWTPAWPSWREGFREGLGDRP
ncbi:MAG TPA: NAD-dependent epimerase/dehydratase family protein [Gemmatimonadota bacterium]|nr:NAD-dependent epimerase/dehydratase family protein [Gemmatimonadota bacterium]